MSCSGGGARTGSRRLSPRRPRHLATCRTQTGGRHRHPPQGTGRLRLRNLKKKIIFLEITHLYDCKVNVRMHFKGSFLTPSFEFADMTAPDKSVISLTAG